MISSPFLSSYTHLNSLYFRKQRRKNNYIHKKRFILYFFFEMVGVNCHGPCFIKWTIQGRRNTHNLKKQPSRYYKQPVSEDSTTHGPKIFGKMLHLQTFHYSLKTQTTTIYCLPTLSNSRKMWNLWEDMAVMCKYTILYKRLEHAHMLASMEFQNHFLVDMESIMTLQNSSSRCFPHHLSTRCSAGYLKSSSSDHIKEC